MVKYVFYVLTLTITLCLAGCELQSNLTDSDHAVYEKILSKYHNLKSYSVKVHLTVMSNKTENKYEMLQCYKEPDCYRVEVNAPSNLKGLTTVTNGANSKVHMEGMANDISVPKSEDLNFTYINSFFKMYYMSEETAIHVSNKNELGTTLLETELLGFGANRYKATMTIDNKTLNPVKLTVFDMAGRANMVAEFTDFVYNENMKDELFALEG